MSSSSAVNLQILDKRSIILTCSFTLLFAVGLSSALQAQTAKPILVQNYYYPKPGKETEVYEWRLHASEVRVKLGLLKGRVLRRVSGETGPYVVWQCEYPSLEAREKEVTELDRSQEFKKVQDHMSTLIDKFERNVWEIDR